MADSSFVIDGTDFTDYAKYLKYDRKVNFLDKYAKRDTSGKLKRELIGTFIVYTVEMDIDVSAGMTKYNELWAILTKAVDFHYVTLPDSTGEVSFWCYVADIKDTGSKFKNGTNKFKSLTVEFIPRDPTISA